jgi:AcrR family transcriptional regulator
MRVKTGASAGRRRPTRREIAAQATRQEIIAAAHRLFVERGYAPTSMSDIADAAGVSIPTIYASVGPKPALLSALSTSLNLAMGRPQGMVRVIHEADPIELLRLIAHVGRELQERFGDLIAALRLAAAVEPEVAKVVKASRDRGVVLSRLIAGRLDELDALRPGVSREEAAAVIDLLAGGPETYGRLVRGHGWSFDQVEAWVIEALTRLLLP